MNSASAQRQADRQQPDLPPGPALLDVVGLIQRVDDGGHAGRRAPDRAEHADGQQSTVLFVCDLENLILDDRQDFARRDAREHSGDGVEQAGDGNEADDRDNEQQRGKEREKEVVGQLGGEAQAVVCQELAGRSGSGAPANSGEFGRPSESSRSAVIVRVRSRPSVSTTVRRWQGTSRRRLRAPDRPCASPIAPWLWPIQRRASRRSPSPVSAHHARLPPRPARRPPATLRCRMPWTASARPPRQPAIA